MDERWIDEVQEIRDKTGWTVDNALRMLLIERLYRLNQRLDDIQKTIARK